MVVVLPVGIPVYTPLGEVDRDRRERLNIYANKDISIQRPLREPVCLLLPLSCFFYEYFPDHCGLIPGIGIRESG